MLADGIAGFPDPPKTDSYHHQDQKITTSLSAALFSLQTLTRSQTLSETLRTFVLGPPILNS